MKLRGLIHSWHTCKSEGAENMQVENIEEPLDQDQEDKWENAQNVPLRGGTLSRTDCELCGDARADVIVAGDLLNETGVGEGQEGATEIHETDEDENLVNEELAMWREQSSNSQARKRDKKGSSINERAKHSNSHRKWSAAEAEGDGWATVLPARSRKAARQHHEPGCSSTRASRNDASHQWVRAASCLPPGVRVACSRSSRHSGGRYTLSLSLRPSCRRSHSHFHHYMQISKALSLSPLRLTYQQTGDRAALKRTVQSARTAPSWWKPPSLLHHRR
jgi:hypothetical protein